MPRRSLVALLAAWLTIGAGLVVAAQAAGSTVRLTATALAACSISITMTIYHNPNGTPDAASGKFNRTCGTADRAVIHCRFTKSDGTSEKVWRRGPIVRANGGTSYVACTLPPGYARLRMLEAGWQYNNGSGWSKFIQVWPAP